MRVCVCTCAIAITQTVHDIETKCGLIRHYVAKHKIRNSTEQKTASMPEKSVFKAKKQNKVRHERG